IPLAGSSPRHCGSKRILNLAVPLSVTQLRLVTWNGRGRMSKDLTNQSDAFALFTQAAERYCLGLSNNAMRSYALRYLTFLQAKPQGIDQEEPKNGRASSFDCVLIRSYLTKLYRDMMQTASERAA